MDTQLPSAHERRSVQRIDSPIELTQLPVVRVESGYKVAGIIIGLVGGLVVLSITGILSGDYWLWGLFTPAGLVGLAIFLGGVHLAIMGMEVTLDEERVAVRTRGLLGRKAWNEELAGYRGVLLRSKWVAGGRDQHSYQVFLVELQHADPKKTVAVFDARRDKGWHATWRAMSIRYRLKALEETPDGVVERAPEDFERSVRERVKEGRLTIAFDPAAPPPAGLAVQVEPDGLNIRVTQRNWRSPTLWTGVGLLLVGGIMVAVFIPWGLPIIVAVFLLAAFGLAAALTVAVFFVAQPRIQIGRETVVASLVTPLGTLRKQVMETARVDDVQIGSPKGQQGGLTLHILTDTGRVYFGAGLSRPALEWLRNCLLATVARL